MARLPTRSPSKTYNGAAPARYALPTTRRRTQEWHGKRKATAHRYRSGPAPHARRLVLLLPAMAAIWWLTTVVLTHTGPQADANGVPHITPMRGSPITLSGGPSLNAQMVDGILAAYTSPLQGHGADLVALSTHYQIDDAVALAFFVMESRAGTQGEALATHSFGNLRPKPGQPQLDGYRLYGSWMEGATDWFRLMRTLYLNSMGRTTLDAIVPVYAPAVDSNDPPTMIAGITQLVSCWRGEVASCPGTPAAIHHLVVSAVRS